MTDLFCDAASIDYPIVDADAHVNEPPNLWLERVFRGVPRAEVKRMCHTNAAELYGLELSAKLPGR